MFSPGLKAASRLRKFVVPAAVPLLLIALICRPLAALEVAAQGLPESRHLAASLSDPESRTDTLTTLLALAHLIQYGAAPAESDIAALADRFRDERSWLERLAGRYDVLPVRGSQFDPGAWFVLRELEQHGLPVTEVVSPVGPGLDALLRQLFDSSDVRLAAALLPEALRRIELESVALWTELLRRTQSDERLLKLIQAIDEQWFDAWIAAEPPAPIRRDGPVGAIDQAADRLGVLMANALLPQAPDPLQLKRLRFDLYSAMPALGPDERREAVYLLALASAVDGLQDRHYLAFAESLLWIVSELLLSVDDSIAQAVEEPRTETPGPRAESAAAGDSAGSEENEPPAATVGDQAISVLPGLLTEWLPPFSSAYAREFAGVDPRINAVLATVFDVAQYLQNPAALDTGRLTMLQEEIADAVAQFVLLLPEMGFYFDQPVRARIAEESAICTSLVAAAANPDLPALTRKQFDGCLESMVEMAATTARRGELAGGMAGPFGLDQLRRELLLTPAQRINYLVGLLHAQYASSCQPPAEPLPNPIEWAGLATLFTWFAQQSPIYFQTPGGESQLKRMREHGLELQRVMAQQLDCISGAGTGINDPLVRGLADYRKALGALSDSIREADRTFRAARLKKGADVVLERDASQTTAYRSGELAIGPCNPERVCGMSGELESTRALVGLFPQPYLIADQTGLGRVEICYDHMKWVNRRAEPVRADDAQVANYFGSLSFELVGRYRHNGEISEVFSSRFVSPDEYHYLFAAASDEVLQDNCPTEWEGQKIVTDMPQRRVRVVPDRLTYLAAARQKPSSIIQANWSRGAEWRDWFVTRLGVGAFEFEADSTIIDHVNRHLKALYEAEQSELYGLLLRPSEGGGADTNGSLVRQLAQVTTRKALVRAQLNLFYPDLLLHSDTLRGFFEGHDALLDRAVLRRYRERGVAVESVGAAGVAQLERLEAEWNRQPGQLRRSGSTEIGVAHALVRLNALYAEFFGVPEPGGAPVPVAASAANGPASSRKDRG
ncbi:MAG: hypothetical protein RQ826_05985 [Xanthomonadales bacterium]|nr:hypothetical protein [Xanthomonadales bacterium]